MVQILELVEIIQIPYDPHTKLSMYIHDRETGREVKDHIEMVNLGRVYKKRL